MADSNVVATDISVRNEIAMPTATPLERSNGAAAISAKAMTLAAALEVELVECVWDIGADLTHEHAHRLDLITAAKSVRVYFPDLELTSSGNASRTKRIEELLQRAIVPLQQRTPAPTYGFR